MATSLTPVETGHLLGGRYRVGPRLGGGGMAEVFEAEDERLGRAVAVKVLRPQMASDEGIRRRFATEARAAARLSHPNVVVVHDVGDEGGNPFLVMELVRGGTLKDRMTDRPVPLEVARRVGIDILAGLEAAHRAGIVHRDVKPGNVLIGADGTARLADFGIAKSIEPTAGIDTTTTAMVIGTPGYLAPERAAGAPATPASDLWSVGVVLYEALTGTKTFQGPTPLAAVLAARNGELVALRDRCPDADPALTAAVHRALSPHPAARFEHAAAMAQALQGQPESATAGMPNKTLEQPAGRRRRAGKTRLRLAAGSAVALLVLLVAWAVAATQHGAVTHRPPTTPVATTTVPVATTPATTAPPQTRPAPPTSLAQPAGAPAAPSHHQNGRSKKHDD